MIFFVLGWQWVTNIKEPVEPRKKENFLIINSEHRGVLYIHLVSLSKFVDCSKEFSKDSFNRRTADIHAAFLINVPTPKVNTFSFLNVIMMLLFVLL